MTFTVAIAEGAASVEALHAVCAPRVEGGSAGWVSTGSQAVGWAVGGPWTHVHDDGSLFVVLDGVLHNLAGTRDPVTELAARYRAEGTEIARGLLGDFVLVVLDRTIGLLLVARDPVGVRPWYQATIGSAHVGATDVATLTQTAGVDTAVDEEAVLRYLAGVTRSDGPTFHKGIRTLRPGCTWAVRGGRTTTEVHHVWDIQPELTISWEDAAARCRTVLDEAVRCRKATSGPPASELSGGLDSSAVVGTAVRAGQTELVVGRLLFEGRRADERGYSDLVAHHWDLRMVSAAPWIPTEEESIRLAVELGRPVPGPNFTMFHSLHQALAEDGRLESLTGLGGDDAFVAAPIGPRVVSAMRLRQVAVLRGLAAPGLRHPRRVWQDVVRPTLRHVLPGRGRVPRWLSSSAADGACLQEVVREAPPVVTGVDAIDFRLDGISSGYHASILEDRAMLADRLGRRDSHPFLDPRVICATYGLDPSWPSRGGHNRALEVAAYADRLPPAVAARRSKAEFSEVAWPQVLEQRTLERLRTGVLAAAGWLEPTHFARLLDRAREGRAGAALPLSRCVAVERWLQSQ